MMTSNYDRQELLAIFNALSPERMVQALGAAGIGIDGGASMSDDMALPDPVDELTPWNKTEVKVPLTSRPPIVNRSQTIELPVQQPMPAQYMGQPGLDNLAPYAATAAG